jgi:hypothetical protein
MALPLFGIEGMIWKNKEKTVALGGDFFIRCVNKRNNKWDADALGVDEGAFATEGHYSLCLADLQGNNAAEIGDELEFYLFKKPNHDKKLHVLDSHVITKDDAKLAGVVIDFIIEEDAI